jgi:hypothetical protein
LGTEEGGKEMTDKILMLVSKDRERLYNLFYLQYLRAEETGDETAMRRSEQLLNEIAGVCGISTTDRIVVEASIAHTQAYVRELIDSLRDKHVPFKLH